ncbi:hypothetical protein HDV00_001492 [Rhizophlyctis rosea]|nr:hypothetical protein HDV00_001492 [Rhizophlyctis rosea]
MYEHDLDVQLAAEALGGMRHATEYQQPIQDDSHHFMQRVSNIPLVHKSINHIGAAYEATKAASQIVKVGTREWYTTESVETGMKSITKPVLTKLEPALAPLDRFGCRTLDKLERSFPSIISTQPGAPTPHPRDFHTYRTMDGYESATSEESEDASTPGRRLSTSSLDLLSPPSVPLTINNNQLPTGKQPDVPGPPLTNVLNGGMSSREGSVSSAATTTAPHIDRKPRSRVQNIVAGVGAHLGGLVISDDTMRGLKYCLQWLQYATGHIDRQIAILRDYLLRAGGAVAGYIAGTSRMHPTPPLSPHNNLSLTTTSAPDLATVVAGIKREVVETLRRVVDIIGRYAAVYLPVQARGAVKGFILQLPGRWASINQPEDGSSGGEGANGGEGSSSGAGAGSGGVQGRQPDVEAQKVLTLATESSSMLKNVMGIFAQTVDGAERYLGRVVGGWSGGGVGGPSGAPPMPPTGQVPVQQQQQQQQGVKNPAETDEMMVEGEDEAKISPPTKKRRRAKGTGTGKSEGRGKAVDEAGEGVKMEDGMEVDA